eukprot:TRINITY_DN1458_c0_g1_i4.p4 TRINITY_DN1458_c0_g1~~TRINITY_DN1458_c0_g1_i4.p4  ORF type:complete len:128 (-),score=17.82 TRINITY_DN1458_c0_g1_i4:173-556(-)
MCIRDSVKNVDYMATKEEVQDHFKSCGSIHRVTIIADKFTGHPKGFAYVEFNDAESVENAKLLDGTLLRGRTIQVLPKRTNVPNKGKRSRPRGGYMPRGYGRGGFYMRGYQMYPMPFRGLRRKFKPY